MDDAEGSGRRACGGVLAVGWSAAATDAIFARSFDPTPNPPNGMEKLFLHMGVFALVTAIVATVCFWFVAQEEKKKRK